MSIRRIVILVSFSLISMLLCYYPNLQVTYSQTDSNYIGSTTVKNSFSGNAIFTDITYPSFWDKFEIPEIKGVLFLSPLKTVGVIIQNVSEKDSISDELYTNLILLMRQNLNDVNIQSTNTTKDLAGEDINTVEYLYGDDSKKFKIQQIIKTGENQVYLLTYFAEDVFYDRFLPLVSTMKTTLFDLNRNEQKVIREPLVENNTIIQNQSMTEALQKNNSELISDNQPVQNTSNVSRNLSYDNPYLGISFEYPSSLNKIEANDGISFFFDQGASGIVVGVIPSSTNSLENFTNEHISEFRSNLENFTLINTTQINLFTNPTQLLSFNYDNDSRLYEGLEYITMDGTDAYVFSYFSKSETFDRYLSLFSDFIESAQLRNLPRIN